LETLGAVRINNTIPDYGFADLVEEHGDSVYRFCRSLAYSKADADDLFQETFLKAFECLPGRKASGNPQAFLFSTALYTWKSWKRRYARRKRLAPARPLYDAAAGDNTAEGLLAREEIRTVRRLVEALPDRFKMPVILYYTMDMSVPDIALTLKIPAGTVKSRLYKARKLIEKGMIEYET
jgi:RNA polymerase sigma-70 factor (ECF subfamily)